MAVGPRTDVTVWVGDDPEQIKLSQATLGSTFLTIVPAGGVGSGIVLLGFQAETALPMLERIRDLCAAHVAELKAKTELKVVAE